MAHLHEMRDSDNHFVIDPITMEITNTSAKHTLQQGDHNSEIYTFELPKVIEGHDMTLCNLVQVHYTNTGSDRTSKSEDVHKITDMAVSADDPNTLVCSWTIHGNATKYAGTLSFRIRFACIESDGTYSYKKHTGTYKDITIEPGDDNARSIEEDQSDTLADIENRIAALGSGIDAGEKTSNKVTTLDENSTDVQYPSAKAVYEAVEKTAELATDSNPDRHAEYFTITSNGALALKPEYRGVSTTTSGSYSISDMGLGVSGSKNTELPKHLVIPEIVDNIIVDTLLSGAFCGNAAIEYITLPGTITALPDFCFYDCPYLKEVYNTENITKIGNYTFDKCSSLKRAKYPNLRSFMYGAFRNNSSLVYADMGNVTNLGQSTFHRCINLRRIKTNGIITSVEKLALSNCYALSDFANIENLTSIGQGAFIGAPIDFDWSTLTSCTFGTNATPAQFNPNNIGSGCTFTPCDNGFSTYFAQTDPDIANLPIGTSGKVYGKGCVLMCLIHSYCGLNKLSLSSLAEFEALATDADPDFFTNYVANPTWLQTAAPVLGLTCNYYTTADNSVVQALYDALANGGYAVLPVDNGGGTMTGHTIVAYGIDNDGKLLCVDSNSYYTYDFSQPYTYPIMYEKTCSPEQFICILSK